MLTEQSLMINRHRTTNQGHLMKQHEINMAPAFLRFQNGVCGSLWQFVAVCGSQNAVLSDICHIDRYSG